MSSTTTPWRNLAFLWKRKFQLLGESGWCWQTVTELFTEKKTKTSEKRTMMRDDRSPGAILTKADSGYQRRHTCFSLLNHPSRDILLSRMMLSSESWHGYGLGQTSWLKLRAIVNPQSVLWQVGACIFPQFAWDHTHVLRTLTVIRMQSYTWLMDVTVFRAYIYIYYIIYIYILISS